MRASRLIYQAALASTGSAPGDICDSQGRIIEPQKGEPGRCAACGEPGRYRLSDAISENFTTVHNNSRAWRFGGGRVCEACLFVARSLPLRATLWFATTTGVWFVATRPHPRHPSTPKRVPASGRPDPLSALLSPPEPPFVAGWGLMGIDHGGESHVERAWWPGSRIPAGASPLPRLQAKHVGIYAEVSHDRDIYPLQVDDGEPILVDVPRWRALREALEPLVADARRAGVGQTDLRDALVSLRAPRRAPPAFVSTWPRRVERFRQHHQAFWWPLLVNIIPIPAFEDKE